MIFTKYVNFTIHAEKVKTLSSNRRVQSDTHFLSSEGPKLVR